MRRGLWPHRPSAQFPTTTSPMRKIFSACGGPCAREPKANSPVRQRAPRRGPQCAEPRPHCAPSPGVPSPSAQSPTTTTPMRTALRRPSMPGPAAVVAQRATCQGVCRQSPSTPETHAQCAVAGCPMSSVPRAQTAVAQCAGPCKPTCLVRMPNKSARCAHPPGVSNSRYWNYI